MRSELYFQSSPWWLLLCLAVGAGYAFALYQRNSGWSQRMNLALAAFRFLVVSVVCFLLLNPLIRSTQTITEKPKVVLAIDNSESMTVGGRAQLNRALEAADQLRERLTSDDIEVSVQTLGDSLVTGDLKTIPFNQRTTDLSNLLGGIRNSYEGRNLTDIVLISDGIANQGLSPTFGRYNFALHTVGVGDTIPKRDVQLKDAVANKIAYLGNQFPIQADVVSYGFQGKNGTVVLRQNGKELSRQTVNFNRPETFQQLTFQTFSNQKGMQHYVIEVLPQSGEFTPRNNRRDVYIDIIDGKEKILLLALTPHPDVKALRSIIEKNQNYELDIRILNGGTAEIPDKVYDLVILHQLPDNLNAGAAAVQKALQKNTPVLFILGNQSGLQSFNGLNPVMQITAGGGQTDKVTGRFNPDFRQLNLDAQKLTLLDRLPPVLVPFGDFKLSPGSEVVLWQQVGSVRTSKPLLAINSTAQRKAAVLAGEGLWEWRLEEFAITDNQAVVDELFQKVMQLISIKEDRRKLRVYPIRNEFLAGEKVTFETEMYNDIYEKLFDRPVRLEITNERDVPRSFNYTPTSNNSRFEVSSLPEGVYRFRATASLNGRTESATGEFIVREQQFEAINTTADHLMLRQLAQQTGGRFYNAATLSSLADDLVKKKPPGRLSSNEELNELINLRWLFFLIVVLISVEWGLRKYHGAY
ncbi:vWA domain-containing protein [Larkinella terrae]|uniref:VWA domain-containing protein n=1 Tax=Larkinella terrae TaxID=2025311 RepID=A0A7K0EMC5_9BACT|nr:vWA domain-containing protein [Larkinella terrae]MRS62959.1 VWA domain-containing protein [Larkinella terrae]